jgi:hypothetical protein
MSQESVEVVRRAYDLNNAIGSTPLLMQVMTRASSGDQIIALYARNRARADAGSSYAPMRV